MTLRDSLSQLLPEAQVEDVLTLLTDDGQTAGAERWQKLAPRLRDTELPPEALQEVWEACYGPGAAVRPMWFPDEQAAGLSNIGRAMADRGFESLDDFYRWSITDRDTWLQECVDRLSIVFRTPPEAVCDLSAGVEQPRWLPGADLNIVESCFQAPDESSAIVFSHPDGALRRISVGDLRRRVLLVAGALRAAGLDAGDRVAVLMPMTPESVAIYLGIIAAGCAAVSIADSFAAPEIRTRLEISAARAIFCTASYQRAGRTIDLYSRVRAADAPQAIVLGETDLRPGDLAYPHFLGSAEPLPECESGPPDRHINILFSSGTTGEPKAIPWTQTVPVKCASDGMWHHDIRPGDVVAWPTNIGWMMGPWLIFAALMNRATIALHHDTPAEESFGQFVQDARVTMLGVVPTIVRSWRSSGCMEQFDLSHVRCFSSTGEASSPDDMFYLSWLAGFRPVIEYCGGTEVGGGYISSTVVQPNVPGCFSSPAMGSDFVILDEHGQPADLGELFLVPPALGLSTELLNRDHHKTYYAGAPRLPDGRILRRHGDYFERLRNGYYRAGGRADDTMNLGGIKVSSAEIERVLNRIDGVNETAAVAVTAEQGGPARLVVFAVTEPDCDWDVLQDRMNAVIRSQLNPLFRVSEVRRAKSLPRTASNKVMRRELRAAIEAEAETDQESGSSGE